MTSLRNRILLFFTVFAIVAFSAIFLSTRNTVIVGRAANGVVSEHLPMVQALGEMEVQLTRQDNSVYRYVTTKEKKWKDVFEDARVQYARWYNVAIDLAAYQAEEDKLKAIDEYYVQFENLNRQVLLTTEKTKHSVMPMLTEGDEFLVPIRSLINQIKELRDGMTIVRQEQIRETLDRHNKYSIYFLLIILLFFGALAVYLWNFLVKPLSMLVEGIRNFTRGRIDVQIPPIGKDELGELQDAFNEMSREIALERKRLKTESQSDPLTGLFNMRYFRLQLSEEFSRSQRYAHPLTLLMIDVDHFKFYNDRNGHPAGDIVLKEVSRILIRNVRGTDIVARYGGEEFVILLPETTMDAAHKVAEKIRKAVEVHHFPFQEEHGAEKLTVSVGVASYPDIHITSDQDLVESSDKALYQAKNSGRNRVCLSTKTAKQVINRRKESKIS